MNYFEYLNNLLTSRSEEIAIELKPAVGDEGEIGEPDDSKTVNYNGSVIFESADENELTEIDFDKILDEDEEGDSTEKKKLSPLEFIIKEFLAIAGVKERADKDGSGKVSKKELESFITELAGMDGDASNLSLADFDKTLEQLSIKLDDDYEEAPITEPDPGDYTGSPVSGGGSGYTPVSGGDDNYNPYSAYDLHNDGGSYTEPSYTPSYTPSYSSSTPSYSSSYSQPSAASANYSAGADNGASNLAGMDLDQLNAEKGTRVANLNTKTQELQAAQNGSNANIKEAEGAKNTAKDAYETALKNDEAAKKYEKEITENNKAIDKNEKELGKTEADITGKETEIKTTNLEITGLESELKALDSALKALPEPTGKEEDKEKDQKIKDQKDKIEKEIKAKEKELGDKKIALEKLEGELDDLTSKKADLEKEKDKLLKEKERLEEELKADKEVAEETKKLLDEYNAAVKHYEEVKTTEVSTAEQAVTDAKNAVDEVEAQIVIAQEAKIKAENSITPQMDINQVPASEIQRYGITEKEMPDGTKVLACSWSSFENCQPEWIDKQKYMLQAAADLGITLVYSDVRRTVSESDAGHARKGNLVLPGGQSPHNYGTAADIVLYKNNAPVDAATQTQFANLVKQYSENTITWGGDWTKAGERHHYELTGWEKYKTPENLIR